MSPRETVDDALPTTEVTRRQALRAFAGGGLALGAGKAVDNVLVGYGVLTGTNLVEQDLAAAVDARFGPSPFAVTVGDHELGYENGAVVVDRGDGSTLRLPVSETTRETAARTDAELELGGVLESVLADLRAIETGEYTFEFSRSPAFFERTDAADTRPYTVGVLRGDRIREVSPATVGTFADADPADPAALVDGLAWGFRHYSGYDVPRYVAGSVQDNVIFGAADLREGFRSPTDFDALLAGENTGLFCYEFTYRSIEAFHAVSPSAQAPPVLGAVVTDSRHKHVYTGLASVIREDGDLIVPMTFVDYTHSTLYDDLGLRGVMGEGVEAYDRRHRTDGVYWNRYARW